MTLLPLLLISAAILVTGYYTYGNFVARKLRISNRTKTPAHTHRDDVDYVPSKVPVVLGHHFASIAGAGPIVGPIIAVSFGWIPAVIWILAGGIFIGAVHDLTSLIASIRHQGKSIGVIIEKYIGATGKRLFLIFSFATLILIIAVFVDIIAKTFVSNPGVATASIIFIGLAIAFGFINKIAANKKSAFVITSVIGVILMYVVAFLGVRVPLEFGYGTWVAVLMGYAFVASVTPVSFLLQPRDYLSSFLLYGLILFGVAGVVWVNPEIKMSNEMRIHTETLGYIFPVLFVTIACGAISGFHSLVSSGTTSKQIDKEKDAKPIGYGGMLIESFLAILSVCAVIVISRTDYLAQLQSDGPVTMFADGLGGIISAVGIPVEYAVTFVALTVSAFALTTLDTCTRLGRFTFQEYFEKEETSIPSIMTNRYFATGIVVVLSVLFLLSGEFTTLWPIFGSANQLLAALALLAVSVWLIKENVKPAFVLIPTFFMFVVTLSSLFLVAMDNFNRGAYSLAVVAGILFVLSLVLIWFAKSSLRKELDLPALQTKEKPAD